MVGTSKYSFAKKKVFPNVIYVCVGDYDTGVISKSQPIYIPIFCF
jgi:hypothetical protein